jgi:hypothetical protein
MQKILCDKCKRDVKETSGYILVEVCLDCYKEFQKWQKSGEK